MKSVNVLLILLVMPWLQNCSQIGNSAESSNASMAANQIITYKFIKTTILYPKCLQCHQAGIEFGGLNVTTYNQVMNFVIPGDPSKSRLYLRTLTSNTFTLTSQERSAIKVWIENGAKNDE